MCCTRNNCVHLPGFVFFIVHTAIAMRTLLRKVKGWVWQSAHLCAVTVLARIVWYFVLCKVPSAVLLLDFYQTMYGGDLPWIAVFSLGGLIDLSPAPILQVGVTAEVPATPASQADWVTSLPHGRAFENVWRHAIKTLLITVLILVPFTNINLCIHHSISV